MMVSWLAQITCAARGWINSRSIAARKLSRILLTRTNKQSCTHLKKSHFILRFKINFLIHFLKYFFN